MSITSPPANSPWGFIEWTLTAAATLFASAGAFLWRLTLRLETIETNLARARLDLDQTREANAAASERLGERFDQLFAEHHRLRESICALPSRDDLRSLDERLAERLEALAARLDRVIDA